MEFKGTKEKWFIDDELSYFNECGVYVTVISTEYVENMIEIFGNNEEDKANALLISKAPEMLEMLKEFIKAIDDEEIIIHENYDNDGYENCGRRLYENFKQIIKEATEIK